MPTYAVLRTRATSVTDHATRNAETATRAYAPSAPCQPNDRSGTGMVPKDPSFQLLHQRDRVGATSTALASILAPKRSSNLRRPGPPRTGRMADVYIDRARGLPSPGRTARHGAREACDGHLGGTRWRTRASCSSATAVRTTPAQRLSCSPTSP